jgi:hypothetical protein
MSKIRKLDKQLFMGAAAKVHEFLDIEPLMPPGRLRFSKLLGRPLMRCLSCKCLEEEFIDNLQGIDCTVAGEYGERLYVSPTSDYCQRLRVWSGHVSAAPMDLVGVVIVSDEDLEFGRRWAAKYKHIWPWVNDGDDGMEAHPAIAYLDILYYRRSSINTWDELLTQRRRAAGLDGIWRSSRDWVACTCGIEGSEMIYGEHDSGSSYGELDDRMSVTESDS